MSSNNNNNSREMGLGGIRRTVRPEPVIPEKVAEEDKYIASKVFSSDKVSKRTKTDLPKSLRLTKQAHTAISAISMIDDIPQYEVVNRLLDTYLEQLDPIKRKIIKSSMGL